MAKVRFIRDTEESILGASPADGTIYVSTDTNNIYIGTADGFERLTKGYTISKSGSTITLTDNDGNQSSVTDANTTYNNATGSAAGLMSASDKTKLDNLDSTISAAIGEEASARQKQDQLLEQSIDDKLGADDIIAGSNIQVNHDDESGHVTISSTLEVPEVTLASLGVTATAQELNYTDGVTSNIQTQLNGKAAASHTHDDRYYTEGEVDGLLAAKANTNHTHSAADIASGTLALDRIPTITDAKIQGMNASKLTGTIPQANLPSYVDDVLEYNGQSNFPEEGESGKIYVDTSTNRTYRWGGSSYVEISSSLALGTTSSTAFRGDYGNTAYQHATAKGSAFTSGLYKITTNEQGHVTAATAVTKNDITALGIPGSDTNTNTTYTLTKSGSTITLEGSDGSSSEVTDANTTYTLSSFGVTATAAELNYTSGVTSNIQTQLNGKASTDHTHNYLPLSGGSLTGTVTSRNLTAAADSTYDIGTSSVRYRNIYADNIYGTVQNAVSSANQLTTARTISLIGDVTGSTSFNGSANVSISARLAANSVTSNEIAANAVGSSELVAGSVNLTKLGTDVGTVAVQSTAPTDTNVKLWIQI